MKVKNYLWTLAAALALVGCSDDLETQKGGPEEGTEQAKGEYYLYFSLDTPETKASDNPTGGEEGDGNEAGTYAENYVKNVALFFVEQTKGIQDAGAKIVGKLFIGEDELTHPEETAATTNYVKTKEPILISENYYTVIKDEIDKKNTPRYAVLAITNLAGGEENTFYKGITEGTSTVKALQDAVIAEGKTNNNGEKGSFVMSSSGESYVTFDQYNNSKKFPAKLSVTVERLSARIDFKATLVDGQAEANLYPIYAKDKNGNTDDKTQIASVKLTDMAVVNQFKGSVYDFKRVSVGDNIDQITWLGDETPAAGVQTNYVLDYDFKSKTINDDDGSLTMSDTDRSGIYDNHVFARNTTTHPTLAEYWATYFAAGFSHTLTTKTTYGRVQYVNENTAIQNAQKNGYSTGVVFKGTATILKAYERKFSSDEDDSQTYVKEIAWSTENLETTDVIYMYKGMPYRDLESIQQLFVQKPIEGELEGDVVDKTATGWNFAGKAGEEAVAEITSLSALKTYKGYFASTDLGYRKYLDNKYAELAKTGDGSQIKWDDVQTEISWETYKEELTEETLNNLYGIKKGAGKTVECYYPYWIRHSNNKDAHTMGIMEFGIVRNNIYKLSVSSLNGFGITELDPDTPDENFELYLEVDLYVKDWVLRYNEDIEL